MLKRNNIKEGFLTDLNDSENVYLLGLLWADGSLPKGRKNYKTENDLENNVITLAQTEDDFPDDLFIKNCITSIYRIVHKPRVARNGKTYCGKPSKMVSISSHPIRQFLEKNDYCTKSSSGDPRKILSLIPDELKHYWWRGFLDGDGCVYFNEEKGKANLLSSHKILFSSHIGQDWTFLEELCMQLKIPAPRITAEPRYTIGEDGSRVQSGSSSTAVINRFGHYIKLGNYIWPNDKLDIGLFRKFDKWKKIKNLLPVFLERQRVKFVYFHTQSQKWRVCIMHKSKVFVTKTIFKTECDAIAWRDNYLNDNNLNHLIEN